MSAKDEAQREKVKVLALVEADVVTGAAKSLLDFCRAAKEHGELHPFATRIETSVATFVRRAGEDQLTREYSNDAATVESPNPFVAAARSAGMIVDLIPERFRFDHLVLSELRRVAASRQPDVIVSYHVKSHFLIKASGLWRQYPWIAFHHGYTTTDAKMRLYNQLDRWSLPTAHRVLTVCEAFAGELTRHKGVRSEQIRVQHNSMCVENFPDRVTGLRLRAHFKIRENQSLIIAIGRFSREKAHLDLINALALLHRNHPSLDVSLLLAGDGPERKRMELLAAELKISERVIYAGHVDDVKPFYAAADVMALPSHSEGSPFVLLEAMAAGVPVVATAVGGVPEIVVNDESALLVSPARPEKLAEALGRVLTEPELASRLKAKASALIATQYSPQTYYQSLADLYLEVIR